MTKYAIDSETLTDIADAIRTKTGGTDPIATSNFASSISGISSDPMPDLVYMQSKNRTSSTEMTYTFTEAGKFQYYIYLSSDSQPATTDVVVYINGTAETSTTLLNTYSSFWYGEVTVSANDVISVSVTSASNRGVQLYLFKYSDITRFSLVGGTGNDDTTFVIDVEEGMPFVETFQMGYYNGNNNYKFIVGIAPASSLQLRSIATPNTSAYWYGGTIVFTI